MGFTKIVVHFSLVPSHSKGTVPLKVQVWNKACSIPILKVVPGKLIDDYTSFRKYFQA